MERFGLDYEHVRRMKPDIIYLNMSMNGNSGPERSYLGYGAAMAAGTLVLVIGVKSDETPSRSLR